MPSPAPTPVRAVVFGEAGRDIVAVVGRDAAGDQVLADRLAKAPA